MDAITTNIAGTGVPATGVPLSAVPLTICSGQVILATVLQ